MKSFSSLRRIPEIALPRGRSARRGVSLIEMLATISILGVLLSVCAMAIVKLLEMQKSGTESLTTTLAVEHLSREFRRDVHRANSAELTTGDDGASRLLLTDSAGTKILWQGDGRGVQRTVEVAVPPRQESYSLGPVDVRFTLSQDNRLVSLAVRPRRDDGLSTKAANGETSGGKLTLDAAVGLLADSTGEANE